MHLYFSWTNFILFFIFKISPPYYSAIELKKNPYILFIYLFIDVIHMS